MDVPGQYAYEDTAQGERLALRQMQALDAHRERLQASGTLRDAAPGATFTLVDHPLHDGLDPGRDRFEARVLVIAGSVGAIGASFELVSAGGKLAAAQWATRVGRIGGIIGGAASIIEGVQAGMASVRTWRRGDYDAMGFYASAAAFLIVGGMVGGWAAATGAAELALDFRIP
ncbi:contractile injection system protein, VgrG/Pvc8 family [Pseudorhodoferax sp.]|uniref:contractile injection system protein, VgrG/Pvc8 family n=1 Tax=Pseudorhodoferax sp. TaxID=1993553 RepID=UPI0039E5F63A